MSKSIKGMLDIAWYWVAFIMLQVLVTYLVNILSLLRNGMDFESALHDLQSHVVFSSTAMIAISAVSSVLTIILFMGLKWTPVSGSYVRSRPWTALLWVVLLSLGTIMPSAWLLEQMEVEVPSGLERALNALMGNRWGYLSVGILVPIAEETVFRGAILRTLLRLFRGRTVWLPIILSALIFGLAHFNMAQLPHAFLMGLLLGWMYKRTNSIVPGVVLHWVNNSVIFIVYNVIPSSADGSLVNIFGGSRQAVCVSLLVSLCIMLPALLQLSRRLKKAEPVE